VRGVQGLLAESLPMNLTAKAILLIALQQVAARDARDAEESGAK
jgi:hypothetical protein